MKLLWVVFSQDSDFVIDYFAGDDDKEKKSLKEFFAGDVYQKRKGRHDKDEKFSSDPESEFYTSLEMVFQSYDYKDIYRKLGRSYLSHLSKNEKAAAKKKNNSTFEKIKEQKKEVSGALHDFDETVAKMVNHHLYLVLSAAESFSENSGHNDEDVKSYIAKGEKALTEISSKSKRG